jgi:predicted Zn-dependent peptidase
MLKEKFSAMISPDMKIHTKKLPNNLHLQAVEMPGTNVVTTLILVGAGSRYEDISIAGISHFLEHMFFKGAQKYKTPKDVAEAVDSFGGEFNAFTGKEYAGYYVKSSREHLTASLDVLSDMMLHSRFDTEEIEKERGVILEEMAMYLDAPMYQISWDFENLVFGDQPLGRDQIGTKKLITSVTQNQFKTYQSKLYVPENTVITIAGAVNQKDLNMIAEYFPFPKKQKSLHYTPFDEKIATQKFHIREKKTEQYHISLGVRALSERDEKFPVLKVLSTILGGNMSARMFQHVREQKGLCYSIRTHVDEYTDTGLLTTRAGVKLDDVLQAVKAIRYEYDDIRHNGVSAQELQKAKNYLCGKIDLSTEDTEQVAHHYGKNTLLYHMKEDFEEWKNQIKSVSSDQIISLAKDIFAPENLRFSGIGPSLDEKKLLALIS